VRTCRTCRTHGRPKDPRLVSRSGFRPFIWNCEAALSRRASRASWSGRLLDDASDQYRRPASHWPLLLGAVENRPGDDGQEEARGRRKRGTGSGVGNGRGGGVRDNRADLPSFLHPSAASGHSLQPLSAFVFSFHSFAPPSSECDFFSQIISRRDARFATRTRAGCVSRSFDLSS